MLNSAQKYRWILAVSTAVLFPALILHTTCVAVMGPGTWGSGIEEALPPFKRPTPPIERYQQEFARTAAATSEADHSLPQDAESGIVGTVRWIDRSGDRRVFLTEEPSGGATRQRLYVLEGDKLREAPIPAGHIVARPKWAGQRIIYERWNPWAIPALHKLRRYVASWNDPSLRPEVSLYGSQADFTDWRHLMPGHSLAVAPDGQNAALLRSGALLAGYYSIHVWRMDTTDAPVVFSLREHGDRATKSFSMSWSADSSALRIYGRTGGFERRGPRDGGGPDGIAFDLLYLLADQSVYDLSVEG